MDVAVPGRRSPDVGVRPLAIALALLGGLLLGELVVAVVADSVTLFADAGHLLIDVGSLAASIGAARLAARPARGQWTFGYSRAEILSAAGNGITLLVVAVLIAYEAVRRLVHPPTVHGGALVAVAVAGIAINVVATGVLARADRGSLNVEGAFQHALTDLYAVIGTLVAGVVILSTGFRRADPLMSLIIAVLMVRAAGGLLRESGRVLLEAAPVRVDLVEVAAHLTRTARVLGIHDLHAWTPTSSLPALSAHVVVDDACFTDGVAPQVLDALQACLVGHFDVEHSTFQLEPASHVQHELGHHP